VWNVAKILQQDVSYFCLDLKWLKFDLGLQISFSNTTLCDKVCLWLAIGRWFSPGTPVSSTNKTDRHDITEILLKVALNTINLNQTINLLQ
jgi:hypothetical protein